MMRIFWIFIFMSGFAHARSLQETFLEGNKLYYQKRYKHALERYESIQQKGPAIWYNIGNAYYRLGDKARALAAWKHAQKNAPTHLIERAHYNMVATESELGIHEVDTASAYMRYRLSLISFFLLQVLFLAGWYLFFILLFMRIPYRIAFLSLVMLSNTLIISAIGFKYWDEMQRCAIVVVDDLIMRAGPDIHFHTIDSIPYAHMVSIKKDLPDWYKIKYASTLGWVPENGVEII